MEISSGQQCILVEGTELYERSLFGLEIERDNCVINYTLRLKVEKNVLVLDLGVG